MWLDVAIDINGELGGPAAVSVAGAGFVPPTHHV
jgi:hypothetical protein